MNYGVIIHILGWVLSCEAVCMLLPLICAMCCDRANIITFVVCIAICLCSGAIMICKAPKKRDLYAKEGFTVVALSWIIMSLFGALPFYISGAIPNFVDALFETVSGFTTTGASILANVEEMPKSLLFWRSFTHWIGGMGVLVFLVAILPLSGGNNLHLIRAESTGPAVSKLVPRVRSTAKILYGIYTVFTIIQIILLLLGGMSLFEALTTAFGTAGTGGFGTRNSSMADFSPYIQYVVAIFMIMFGVDFSFYYGLLMLRGETKIKISDEIKTYFLIIAISTLIIGINTGNMFSGIEETFRHSLFQVGSIITTTGFATTDFDLWPELSKMVLVALMFIGACAGSTGGGIKVSRIIIALKTVVKELKITAHPMRTHKITMNGRMVEHETIRATNVFLVSYAVIFALSALIISLDNMSFTSNFTAVAATLNNIGPGLAEVGPTRNFAEYSQLSKLVFIFNMLVGRLEIFPMLILFSPQTWRK